MSALNSLDYSRFDHLDSDSDSDEDSFQDHPKAAGFEEMVNKLFVVQGGPGPDSTSRTRGFHRSPSQIKIHPEDHSAPAWVYSDPDTWEAPPDPDTGKKHTWGTAAAAAADDSKKEHMLASAFRMMHTQGLYGFGRADYPDTPGTEAPNPPDIMHHPAIAQALQALPYGLEKKKKKKKKHTRRRISQALASQRD